MPIDVLQQETQAFVTKLKDFSSIIKKTKEKHAQNQKVIERDRDSSLSVNDDERRKLEAKLRTTKKQIAEKKQEVYNLVKRNFTATARSSMQYELNFFEIAYDAVYNEATVSTAQTELKKLLRVMRTIEEESLPENEQKRRNIIAEADNKQAEEQKRFEQELENVVRPVKTEYDIRHKRCVKDYTLDTEEPLYSPGIPDEIVIGNLLIPSSPELRQIDEADCLRLPLIIDAQQNGDVVLTMKTNDLYDAELEGLMVGLAMKYLEAFPCGTMRVGVFSSVYSSCQKLNAFYNAAVRGNKADVKAAVKENIAIQPQAASNQPGLSSLLSAVKLRAEEINQILLEKGYDSIYDLYYEGNTTAQFQLVIVQDALRDMTEENLRELYGCISGYHKSGVRFIIIDDFSEENYKNKSALFKRILNQLKEYCQLYSYSQKSVVDKYNNALEFVHVSEEVDQRYVYDFVGKYCSNFGEKKKASISYEEIGFGHDKKSPDEWNKISIPIGKDELKTWHITLSCQEDPPIANLIIGVPGTGKSKLIDAMILNGAIKYSPDELVFQLLDFKDGISSSTYTEPGCRIPHVKVVSQENKPEDAGIILSNILHESEQRNDEFKKLSRDSGQQIRNIAEYNKAVASGKYNRRNMPRLVIVIDECQYLFEDEALAKQCEDIVRKCRAQGIHLILATQTLSRKMWSTIKFVDGRYCFEIANEDAEQLLARKYVPLIKTDVPLGSHMAFASNDGGKECQKIKVAYDGGDMAFYAQKIRGKWSDYEIHTVQVGDKSPLMIKLDEFEDSFKSVPNNDEITVPIGENYGDHTTVTAQFRNEKQSAMLLVGTNENVANSICKSVILSAKHSGAEVYAVDASMSQSLAMLIDQMGERATQLHVSDESGYMEMLHEVSQIYEKRRANIRQVYQPIVFVINAAHRINELLNDTKQEMASISEPDYDAVDDINAFYASMQNPTPQKQSVSVTGKGKLMQLISSGYTVGIYICIAIDSMAVTNDMGEAAFGYAQKTILSNCNFKILFNDLNGDYSGFMETSFKGKMLNGLNENMAFMSDRGRSYYKFRVFQYSD